MCPAARSQSRMVLALPFVQLMQEISPEFVSTEVFHVQVVVLST